ncbi:MAG: hypothetical protein KDI06_05380, partial [Calditrichaeota bacterium]|nr:hypothetical protein [Calditrichota bacterium]
MSNRYFKILFNLPDDGLPLYLKTNLVFHNLDLYAAPNLSDFSAYVKQFRPHLSIIFMDQDPQQFEECLHIIRDGHQQSEMWFLVLYDHRLPIEKIRSNLPGKRVFLLKDTTEHSLVAHNILTIKELVNLQSEQKLKHRFEESFNQCLQVIYQERYLNRTFERLINILPKTISLDYWAIFTLNPQMTRVEYFSQFMPPTRRRLTTLLPNLSNFARAWLKSNKPFLVNRKSRPEV